MKPTAFLVSFLVLSIALLGSAIYTSPSASAAAASTTTICMPTASPFITTDVSWGTGPSQPGPGPGSLDAPLTLALIYTGPCAATAVSFKLNLSAPFYGTAGTPNLTDYAVNVATDSALSETYYVDVSSNASLGIYTFPLYIGYNTSTYTGLFSQTLKVGVSLNGIPSLNFSPSSHYLYAGQINRLTVATSNNGTGNAVSIDPVVSSPTQLSNLNSLSPISLLVPGAINVQTLQIFVPSSMAGSATSLTIAAAYYDSYSVSSSTSQTVGFYVTSAEPATPFQVMGVTWGSADSSPQPGDQNVPLVATFQYTGSASVNDLSAVIVLPIGYLGAGGGRTATAFSPTVAPGGTVQITFYLDIERNATLGTVFAPIEIDSVTSTGSSLNQTTEVLIPKISNELSPFALQTAEWGASNPSPQPGDSNVALVVTLQYEGATVLTEVQATATLPSGVTSQSGGSSAAAYLGAVALYQSVQLTFYLNLADSVSPGSYSFALSLNYSSAFASGRGQIITVAPPALGQRPSGAGASVSVAQLNDSVSDGASSSLSFRLTNSGTETIYSPALSVTASSPLIVLGSSPSPDSSLAPGQSETLTAVLSASPTATPGIYSGSVSVTFLDPAGSQHSQAFPAGFVLAGTVKFVVQDESVTQSSSGLTVSGSLLNEGGTPAYYAQVTGSVEGFAHSNATAYYVGEIDPNTPQSFTLTVPLAAPASARSATVLLGVNYQDSFGNNKSIGMSSNTELQSAQQLAGGTVSTATAASSGGNLVSIVFLVVVAAIVVVGVAGAVMVRRRRAVQSPRKEKKVI